MDRNDDAKEIKRRDQVSHIFTGEDPSSIKESQKKHIKPQTSNIIFNDSYNEKPQVKEYRKARYEFEQRIKSNSEYSDDMKKGKDTIAFKRKIQDSYLNNPMKIYNKEEHKKYNEGEKEKFAHRAKAFNNVFGSDKCKRTLGGISKKENVKSEKQNSDKVTNNNFNITKNAMILNKNENQQVPYYGRKQFAACSSVNGKGMTYL